MDTIKDPMSNTRDTSSWNAQDVAIIGGYCKPPQFNGACDELWDLISGRESASPSQVMCPMCDTQIPGTRDLWLSPCQESESSWMDLINQFLEDKSKIQDKNQFTEMTSFLRERWLLARFLQPTLSPKPSRRNEVIRKSCGKNMGDSHSLLRAWVDCQSRSTASDQGITVRLDPAELTQFLSGQVSTLLNDEKNLTQIMTTQLQRLYNDEFLDRYRRRLHISHVKENLLDTLAVTAWCDDLDGRGFISKALDKYLCHEHRRHTKDWPNMDEARELEQAFHDNDKQSESDLNSKKRNPPARLTARISLSYLRSTVTALACATCAYTMRNYADLRRHFTHSHHNANRPPGLAPFLTNPSPNTFVVASIIHGVTAYLYYVARSEDRFREWFVAVGIVSGTLAGFLTGTSIEDVLIGMLPIMLISSLVICTGVTSLWYCCNCGNGKKLAGEGDGWC